MTENELYMLLLTTLLGVVGFFLKKAFSDIDKKADKESLRSLENEVDSLRKTTTEIKGEYLTREEFLREQLKTEKKLDKIMDILMEIKGGSGHGHE